MNTGNNLRASAYAAAVSSFGAAITGLALGAASLPAAPETGGASEIPGGTEFLSGVGGMSVAGYLDTAGLYFQGAATQQFGEAKRSATDLASDFAIGHILGSPFSSFYDFGRGAQMVLNGPPTPQTCQKGG